MRSRNRTVSKCRLAAERTEAAIREADAAGELWGSNLSNVLGQLRLNWNDASPSLINRLERRLDQMVDAIGDAKSLPNLRQAPPETIGMWAEHASCLGEADIERFAYGGYYIPELLRNRNLEPEVRAGLAGQFRASLLGQSRIVERGVHSLTPTLFEGIQAVLSLPATIKEAGWRHVDNVIAERRVLDGFDATHPDPDVIAGIAKNGDCGRRRLALGRPDLTVEMEEWLLGGDDQMVDHLISFWKHPPYPSARAMRRALEMWPDDELLVLRVADLPGAPLNLLRDIARRWCAKGRTEGAGSVTRALSARRDAVDDPEIRALLFADPADEPLDCLRDYGRRVPGPLP